MGKDGFLTPKAIANRIKAKGLQKLRWYCQMCQKQCRDENGFKCHCSSESHQRQMQIFAQKPGKFLDEYSREFRDTFLRQLKHSHGTKRTYANAVYNEYIKDRHHTHMNATKWSSLSGFCQYLGKAGYCTIDETPKGWYIAYIDRDPAVLEQQKRKERRERSELSEEERERKRIEKQLKKAKRAAESQEAEASGPTEFQKQGDEKIAFSLFSKPKKEEAGGPEKVEHNGEKANAVEEGGNHEKEKSDNKENEKEKEKEKHKQEEEVVFAVPQKRKRDDEHGRSREHHSSSSSRSHDSRSSRDDRDDGEKRSRWDKKEPDAKRRKTEDVPAPSKPKNAMEEIMLMEEQKKERMNRLDYWLTPGIVVKVKHKTLANGKYYNEKGVVQEVEARYVAHVKMLTSGDLLKIDQEMLETVLPALGGRVRIVNGAYRGSTAVLKEINVDKFCATVVIDKGPQSGRELTGVEYEDICKIADTK